MTKCIVGLEDGTAGHAYIAGSDAAHAEMAAVMDAMLQEKDSRDQIMSDIIIPLQQDLRDRKQKIQSKVAATRVDFFTLVQGRGRMTGSAYELTDTAFDTQKAFRGVLEAMSRPGKIVSVGKQDKKPDVCSHASSRSHCACSITILKSGWVTVLPKSRSSIFKIQLRMSGDDIGDGRRFRDRVQKSSLPDVSQFKQGAMTFPTVRQLWSCKLPI